MSDRCSIIITSYNYERYLPLAIESALAQTWRAVDVIVVDDGSSDGSPGVIASYGDRVVPVLKENGGQASAFNAGLAVATGDVVIFLDADDLLDPDGVASIMPGFDDERVVKVHWPLRLIDADGARLPGTKPSAVLPEGDLAARVLEGGPTSSLSAPTSGNAWRRSFLDAVGPLPEDVGYYRMCADEYLYTLAPVFGLVARVQRPVGSYRLHGTNVYSARSAEQKLDLEVAGHTEQCGALARTLARHGIQADVDRWRQNSWFHRLRTAVDVILATVPDGESFVLVDEDQWDLDGLVGTRRCTVVGALTVSGGPPADDAESIVLLSALLYYEYIAIGWPAFWWFERYERLTEELHGAYEAVVETGEVVILRRRAAS